MNKYTVRYFVFTDRKCTKTVLSYSILSRNNLVECTHRMRRMHTDVLILWNLAHALREKKVDRR